MGQVEIARFDDPGAAQLAVRFLESHGILAFAPYFPYSTSIGTAAGIVGETPLVVEESEADEARLLFQRVAAGEFSEDNTERDSRGRLGAALAEALLPDPAFKAPSRLEGIAPVLVVLSLPVIGLVAAAIFKFLLAD